MLVLQTNSVKQHLLFEALFVTLELFFIELLVFLKKVKFLTRVYKGKFTIF